MPIDQGTLAGYDQLLSISQEAINRQLKVLYLTEVDPPIPNGPTHLINHEMHFHTKKVLANGKVINARDGLDAYVCCPQVDFTGERISDAADKYRQAIIKFKFRKAEEWELSEEDIAKGKTGDSVLVYKEVYDQDDEGNDMVRYPEVVINGWEISWAVLIDKQDVQDVFKEIIEPASQEDSKISISDGLKKKLEEVNSSNFQVSTIFCVMQSARMIQSFTLLDANGNEPTEIRNRQGNLVQNQDPVQALKEMLVDKFRPKKDSKPLNGPTPDNPFVLGYTVSQKKPEFKKVNPAAAAANIPSPAYFVPKSFRCNLSPSSVYSAGTLNYCMLTHRALQPPYFDQPGRERHIDDGVDGAGRFPQNVFGRVKQKAIPGSADGALFFCQDIFVNHWIGSSVAPLFYLSPEMVTTKMASLIESKYKHLNMRGQLNFSNEISAPTRQLSRNNEYVMTNSLRSSRRVIAQNGLDDPTESVKIEYDTTVHITYDNLNELRDSDEDIKRRLQFTIGSYTTLKIKFYRRLVTSHVGDWLGDVASGVTSAVGLGSISVDKLSDDNWEEAYDANLWLNFQHVLAIGTSAANRGSFAVESVHAAHLTDGHGELISQEGLPPTAPLRRDPGFWHYNHAHNWAGFWGSFFTEELGSLTAIGEDVAKGGKELVQGALNDLTESLGATVILPAGDVFMFKGLGTDAEGNVFTTVTYDTPVGGDVRLRAAKDVLQSGWQAPVKAEKMKVEAV